MLALIVAVVLAVSATATAIPQVVTPTDPVWLLASGFETPPDLVVTSPDGTQCAEVVERNQAFVVPADCSPAAGRWTARFSLGDAWAETAFLVR